MPEECFICYDTINQRIPEKQGSELKMTHCGCHPWVHQKCLMDWWESQTPSRRNRCPMCRTEGTNRTIELIMHPCSSTHIPESVAIPVQVGMDSTEDSRLESLISDVEEQIQIIESYQTAVHLPPSPSLSPPLPHQSECYQKLRQTCMHPTPQQALCMVGFGACIFFFGIVFPISIS